MDDATTYTELESVLARLIEIPSVSGDEAESVRLLNYAGDYLQSLGMTVERLTRNGYPSLFASTSSKRPRLLLQSHIDVVPANQDQYSLTSRDGKLFGRGVFDMKFAAAAFMVALAHHRDTLSQLDVGIMLTSDEEVNGSNGTGYLVERGYGARDVVLLPDGGDEWAVEASAKGAWIVKASAEGVAGHGSRPWEGDNAIEKIMAFITQVRELGFDDDKSGPTLTVSQLNGGEAINQIPATASAVLDMRIVSLHDMTRLKNSIEQLAKKHAIELDELVQIMPVQLDTTLPVVTQWQDAVTQQRGVESREFIKSFGASDARYFAPHHTPVIVTRPRGGGAHATHEWLDRQDFHHFYDAVASYIKKFNKDA